MLRKSRWVIYIILLVSLFLFKEGTLYASNTIKTSNIEVGMDLTSERNSYYSFGFSSNEIKNTRDDVNDITQTGIDLVFSNDNDKLVLDGQQVYAWWKVLSSRRFTLSIQVSSLRKNTPSNGVRDEIPVVVEYTTKEQEEKRISSDDQITEGILYMRKDTGIYGEADSIPLVIYSSGIEGIASGEYFGEIRINLLTD